MLSLLGGLRGLFAGSGPVWADQQAYAALFGLVQREATMVALVRIFQFLGVLVLTLIPLIRPDEAAAKRTVRKDRPALNCA